LDLDVLVGDRVNSITQFDLVFGGSFRNLVGHLIRLLIYGGKFFFFNDDGFCGLVPRSTMEIHTITKNFNLLIKLNNK
jgi:hypothetical protein